MGISHALTSGMLREQKRGIATAVREGAKRKGDGKLRMDITVGVPRHLARLFQYGRNGFLYQRECRSRGFFSDGTKLINLKKYGIKY